MLINFKGQSDKNFLLHKPNGESPKQVEVKKDTPEKKPEDKNDFSNVKNRLDLYEQAKQTIATLKARPDQASQKKAETLQKKLDDAQASERNKDPDEIKMDFAHTLKVRLDSIARGGEAKPLSEADAKRLSAELDKMNKKDESVTKPTVAKDGAIVFTEEKITAPKPTRKETLDDAKSFGMIGLIPKEAPQPAFGEKKAEKAPDKPLAVRAVSLPTIDKDSQVVISDMSNPPQELKTAGANYEISNRYVVGYRYFQGSNGQMWRAEYKPRVGSDERLISYKKVSIVPKTESKSA